MQEGRHRPVGFVDHDSQGNARVGFSAPVHLQRLTSAGRTRESFYRESHNPETWAILADIAFAALERSPSTAFERPTVEKAIDLEVDNLLASGRLVHRLTEVVHSQGRLPVVD